MLSRLMRAIPAAARYSASLAKLQVPNARPRSRGQHRASRQTSRRTCSLIDLGLPPLHFGSNAANPDALNAWITVRTYSGEQSSRCAISGALCSCADISTTIARRSLTGSLAVRPIRCNRRPSVIYTGRTNTSTGRAIATSENSPGSSLPYPAKDRLHERGSWTRHWVMGSAPSGQMSAGGCIMRTRGPGCAMLCCVDVNELQDALGGVVLESAYLERTLRTAFSALFGSKYAAVGDGRLTASALIEDCERLTRYHTA